MSEPRAESPPTAGALTNWLMSLGWETVVVTEHFVLVKMAMSVKVWTREWVEQQMKGVATRHSPEGLDVVWLIENILMDAMKGAAK